ncbi:glycoside hydrolase family 3 protein [Rhizoctonia solani AG-1 IA]|uniref:beta-glucosidase n=1 Tax=Thanatephorus cucumeris (strain AG1-IA) TaxID=983506 RepID=L8WRM8_THACA|nr:glycoside hydrolase family 3 protein [Rhizoctonia solani AG-1 IA]
MVRIALAAALVASAAAAPNGDALKRADSSAAIVPGSPAAANSTIATGTILPTASATTSTAPINTTAPNTPVPTGVLPDDYFVKGNTPRTWSQALALAAKFVAPMSIEEKTALTTGVGFGSSRCVGNIIDQPKYKFPGLCLQDSPLGVRLTDRVSAFTAGINAAATWDRNLIRARGVALGEEFRGKGVNVALGPAMNLARVAAGGRNWEGFGADPYLSGEAAYETILGIQSTGVQACEQEIKRDASSSDVDDRAQHELYAHPFLRSVAAGVASFMCSYNQINGTYSCENDKVLNGILKTEYGFPGYVMSDWWATHSTESANRGLDMEMPGGLGWGIPASSAWLGGNLTQWVKDGRIPEARLTDMATRIIAGWYLTGQEKGYPAVNFNTPTIDSGPLNLHVDVQGDHYKGIREMGAASTILLKNTKGTLPLKKPVSLAIIAPPLRGPNGFTDRAGVDGTLAMAWGSGSVSNLLRCIKPLEAIQARAKQDHTSVSWHTLDWDTAGAKTRAKDKDVAIVFINSDSGEGYLTVDGNRGDRNNLTAWNNGDNLVREVASANSNTVVVVHSVGPIIMEPWIDNPNVTAVLWAGLPGQESGNALVDVLYGAVNPSAKLPYTIAKQRSDYGTEVVYDESNGIPHIPYSEGTGSEVSGWEAGKVAPKVKGASLAPWLHAPYYDVSFDIKNTGQVVGHEVRGFARVALKPGQTQRVTLTLSRYDLSAWDVARQGWAKIDGQVGVTVGASSRDFRLKGTLLAWELAKKNPATNWATECVLVGHFNHYTCAPRNLTITNARLVYLWADYSNKKKAPSV